jgi:hypothetical protein
MLASQYKSKLIIIIVIIMLNPTATPKAPSKVQPNDPHSHLHAVKFAIN